MGKSRKSSSIFNKDESYAEAERLIQKCREKGVKKLDLSHLSLKAIPPELAELETLTELNITGRVVILPLTITGDFKTLPVYFGNLSSLKKLSIINTRGITLPETFGKLSSLEELYIDDNKMTALPKSIGKCSGLKQLRLRCDNLAELPSSIGSLINLEEFNVTAFNLKKLPDTFDNLTSLKSLDIFSGALTAFPASIGNLKKLKNLSLDAYNVRKLPESFKQLAYVEQQSIDIGRKEPYSMQQPHPKKKRRGAAVVNFDELKYMSYQYRWKILEQYSLKELEALICSVPSEYGTTGSDKEIVKNIFRERQRRLNRKFSWTPENIKRITAVSDKFLAAWEDGFSRAKTMIDMLYEKETDKDAFWENHDVEIILHPDILAKDEKNGEWDSPYNNVYSVLLDYLPECELAINIVNEDYNPATKDEKGFREDINVNHDLSWNIEGFGDIDLQDQYICYAIHVLYSHNEWANKDILKINNIETEVRVTYRYNSGVF